MRNSPEMHLEQERFGGGEGWAEEDSSETRGIEDPGLDKYLQLPKFGPLRRSPRTLHFPISSFKSPFLFSKTKA